MPPRKKVQRLEDLCSSNVANGVFDMTSLWYQRQEEGGWFKRKNADKGKAVICAEKKSKELQHFLKENLPSTLRERILEDTLNVISKSLSIPRSDDDTHELTCKFIFLRQIHFYMKYSLKCLFTDGITYLDLTPIAHLITKQGFVYYYKNETTNIEMFTDSLNDPNLSLTTLKYLKLPHFIYDEFISLVATHCKELEYLIMNCSPDCNTPKGQFALQGETLQHLCGHEDRYNVHKKGDHVLRNNRNLGCKKLKQLILPKNVEIINNKEIAVYGEMFLTHMNNLEYLVGVPMLNLPHIYESILSCEQGENKMSYKIETIRLKNFYHGAYYENSWPFYHLGDDLRPNLPDVSFTPQLFSVLKEVNEINICAPADITEVVLKAFPYAQNVTMFTEDYNLHRPYLNNLVKIDINIGHQNEWPILNHICISSPKLEDLTLRSKSLDAKGNGDVQTPIKLPELKILKLLGQYVIHSDSLIKLVSGCPSITILNISMLKYDLYDHSNIIRDKLLSDVIPLVPNLQEFSFNLQLANTGDKIGTSFRIGTLNALVENCPNLHSIAGIITSINIMDRTELNKFYLKCKENNWDLEIKERIT